MQKANFLVHISTSPVSQDPQPFETWSVKHKKKGQNYNLFNKATTYITLNCTEALFIRLENLGSSPGNWPFAFHGSW